MITRVIDQTRYYLFLSNSDLSPAMDDRGQLVRPPRLTLVKTTDDCSTVSLGRLKQFVTTLSDKKSERWRMTTHLLFLNELVECYKSSNILWMMTDLIFFWIPSAKSANDYSCPGSFFIHMSRVKQNSEKTILYRCVYIYSN